MGKWAEIFCFPVQWADCESHPMPARCVWNAKKFLQNRGEKQWKTIKRALEKLWENADFPIFSSMAIRREIDDLDTLQILLNASGADVTARIRRDPRWYVREKRLQREMENAWRGQKVRAFRFPVRRGKSRTHVSGTRIEHWYWCNGRHTGLTS